MTSQLPANMTRSTLLEPLSTGLQVPACPLDGKVNSIKRTAAMQQGVQVSLVIPTYNEAKNIPALIELLSRLLDRQMPHRYELIVVDDDSPDRTWEVAQSLMAHYPALRVMRRQQERGLSTAVIRGWQVAEGEILGVIDGDMQHPPEILLQLIEAIQEGADLAVASRHIEGGGVSDWSLARRVLSRGAQFLGLLILPRVVGRVSDPMSGYFMVRRSAIAEKPLSPVGYKILLEVIGRGDIAVLDEVGYVFQERTSGESKVTWKQYVEYLHHLIRLRSGRLSRIRQLGRRFPVQRLMKFGAVGLSGVFVDMAVFYLLSDPTTLAWGLTRSKLLAAEVAIFNNFLWNDRWTFGDLSGQQRGWVKRCRRFVKFNLVCLVGLTLNILLLNLLFNGFGLNRYLANFVAIAAVTLWNFWLNLKLSWRVTDTRK
jgi:dolichol-phosphate mannosyltransferase